MHNLSHILVLQWVVFLWIGCITAQRGLYHKLMVKAQDGGYDLFTVHDMTYRGPTTKIMKATKMINNELSENNDQDNENNETDKVNEEIDQNNETDKVNEEIDRSK
ncbi:hypothetical protein C2G38_2183620 [Gigaspora rosea]|uniref:Uncharacterized protein n=1 Tax=Gigaspora rosea TaxID=44941 RepID=A0A397V9T3_9GLOM|nr:hypothetical protein C2G38_2183620 [Gigaspora rosea]